jgi:hypothetical protein
MFLKGIRHLSEWIIATYFVESNPRGVSPRQLQRLLGMSYRTTTRLARVLRREKKLREILFKFCICDNESDAERVREKVHE